MRVFADTSYWAALINPRDPWREHVLVVSQSLNSRRLVTTQEVLVELGSFFSGFGAPTRLHVIRFIRSLVEGGTVDVIPQSNASFVAGMALYEARPDKGYSLVDCISMQTMRELGISEALTHDHHFEQEGFVALLRTRG